MKGCTQRKKAPRNWLMFFCFTIKGRTIFQLLIEVYSQNTVTVATAVQATAPSVAVQLYCPSSDLLTFTIVN